MDFQPQIGSAMPVDAPPLPFFLAYPNYPCQLRNKERIYEPDRQDFEYLQRSYPAFVARMQKRVEEILDRMDYEGSMIYDEYPDRLSIQTLGEAVGRILSADDRQGNAAGVGKDDHGESTPEMAENGTGPAQGVSGESAPRETTLENAYLRGLAQVLTCNEIYRRRQKRKQGTNGRITTAFGVSPE